MFLSPFESLEIAGFAPQAWYRIGGAGHVFHETYQSGIQFLKVLDHLSDHRHCHRIGSLNARPQSG
jgi:hypothetical protein